MGSWLTSRPAKSENPIPITATGDNAFVAVTLAQGQIYYGTASWLGSGYVRLEHTYYVQETPQPNGTTQFKLVNRHTNDWHGPNWMLIPTDKILYLEDVGSSSRLAALIAQERKAASK